MLIVGLEKPRSQDLGNDAGLSSQHVSRLERDIGSCRIIHMPRIRGVAPAKEGACAVQISQLDWARRTSPDQLNKQYSTQLPLDVWNPTVLEGKGHSSLVVGQVCLVNQSFWRVVSAKNAGQVLKRVVSFCLPKIHLK